MRPSDFLILLFLAALWGASFVLVRVVSPVFGPFVTAEARLLLGGLAVWLYARWLGQGLEVGLRWRHYLILGAINGAIPFFLIAFALLHIHASMATIINSTSPLFAALVSALWLGQRFRPWQLLGLLLGVSGVVVLVGWSPVPLTPTVLQAVGAGLLAAFCFGFSTVYARRYTIGSPTTVVAGQLLGASMLLLVPSLLSMPKSIPPTADLIYLALLGLLATGLGNVLFFYLIASAGPTQAASVGFLIPLFGIVWSYIFLKEPLTLGLFAGLGLVLLSVALVNNLFRSAEP